MEVSHVIEQLVRAAFHRAAASGRCRACTARALVGAALRVLSETGAEQEEEVAVVAMALGLHAGCRVTIEVAPHDGDACADRERVH